ncbi:MAG: DUF3667 domain-containing protein [Bacteroidota bacterium]
MSHLKERKDKNCLNCNAHVEGRFCHICGQENIEPKESAWHLINHFFQDITHFDGKFFSTLWLLITRPGFLPAEYARGRRASYLNPVRMYIFTSAFFFLFFFTFFKGNKHKIVENSTINGKTLKQVDAMDSVNFAAYTTNINKEDGKPSLPMTRNEFNKYYDSVINNALDNSAKGIKFSSTIYKSKLEYDSLLQSGAIDDNWLERRLNYKGIEMNEKYKDNKQEEFKDMIEIFLHKMPQILFVSLPILALLLKLLYARRKEFYYVSHGIFSLHFYIFIFIVMFFSLSIGKINANAGWTLLTVVRFILVFSIFFYLYRAMQNFYRQGWGKTLLKFIILTIVFLTVLALLFVLFLLLSFFSV